MRLAPALSRVPAPRERPRAPPHLEAYGITKRFGALTVLDEAGLRLAPGDFHALLGGNGAGKSTLVKCIMGYYRADAGSVLIDDREDRDPARGPAPRPRHGLPTLHLGSEHVGLGELRARAR